MKKHLLIAIAILASLAANAQYTKFDPNAGAVTQQDHKSSKKDKAKKDKAKKISNVQEDNAKPAPVSEIDPKYGVGSCPEVDGKIEWSTTIACPGRSAKHIYDNALAFLAPYCKEKDKEENSQIAIINPTTHEIGARIGEYVVFQNHALSLDRAMLNYTLCLYCSDGKCQVVMKSMSYKYEGNNLPVEEMLLDKNALNKTKTKFHKGGFKKFRTKTIDAKETLFQKLSDAINKNS